MARPARVPHALATVVALAAAVVAALALLAAPAWAGPTPDGAPRDVPRVHHVFPQDGAVLRTAPDHVEVMFDVELVPGDVAVGLAPDATGVLVPLAPPQLDGPLLVQPLPPLPPGRYTVGVQLRDADGRVSRGTVRFAVGPAVAPAAGPGPGRTGAPASWLVPLVGATLVLPALLAVAARRTWRRAGNGPLTPRPRAGGAAGAGPGRAAGRTPTSAWSRAGRRGR